MFATEVSCYNEKREDYSPIKTLLPHKRVAGLMFGLDESGIIFDSKDKSH